MDEIASFIIALKMILYDVMNLTKYKSIYFNDTCTAGSAYFCTLLGFDESYWITGLVVLFVFLCQLRQGKVDFVKFFFVFLCDVF